MRPVAAWTVFVRFAWMDTTPVQTCFRGSAAAALRQAVPHTISITYRGEHISNSPSVAAVGAAPIDFPVPLTL